MSKKLFVGNLSYDLTQEGMQQVFSEVGTVVSARIVTDRTTGRSKGFAFVEMSTNEEGQEAIRVLNGREILGRPLRVTEANDNPPLRKEGGRFKSHRQDSDYGSRPRHQNGY